MQSRLSEAGSQRKPQTGTFGPDFRRQSDAHRLNTQMERVRDHMLQASARGQWLTLSEICNGLKAKWRCHFPEPSISAQCRHLKKAAFGGYRLEKRRRHGPGYGLFEYRLLSPERLSFSQQDLFARAHA